MSKPNLTTAKEKRKAISTLRRRIRARERQARAKKHPPDPAGPGECSVETSPKGGPDVDAPIVPAGSHPVKPSQARNAS